MPALSNGTGSDDDPNVNKRRRMSEEEIEAERRKLVRKRLEVILNEDLKNTYKEEEQEEEQEQEQEEDNSVRERFERAKKYMQSLFSTNSSDDEDENNASPDISLAKRESTLIPHTSADEESLHSLTSSSLDEGSISSVDLDDNDNFLQLESSSPTRIRTHIDDENSRQQNLFLLLPKLQRE